MQQHHTGTGFNMSEVKIIINEDAADSSMPHKVKWKECPDEFVNCIITLWGEECRHWRNTKAGHFYLTTPELVELINMAIVAQLDIEIVAGDGVENE